MLMAVILVAMMVACSSGDLTLNQADPTIVPQKPVFAQVYPIFQRDCIPCHAGTDEGSGREGADKVASRNDPGMESCRSIVNNLDDIVDEVFIKNSMPPGAWPRLTSKERLTIERWVDAGPEASCD